MQIKSVTMDNVYKINLITFTIKTLFHKSVNGWSKFGIILNQKSFKKCGISNVLNGTEDDVLFNDDNHRIENEYQSSDNEDNEFYGFKVE